MKSLEVWRKGYKAEFSPGLGRSKCKVSPLPCFSWDSVGGVGQGQFCILHKSGIDSPILWRAFGHSSPEVTLRYLGITDEEDKALYRNMCIHVVSDKGFEDHGLLKTLG